MYIILVSIIQGCYSKKWVPLEKEQSVKYLQYYLKDEDVSVEQAFKSKVLLSDEETAIEIAETYLFKTYGRDLIINERPYKIGLINGYWVIVGSLPKLTIGGYFEIVINSKNGAVIGIAHGK